MQTNSTAMGFAVEDRAITIAERKPILLELPPPRNSRFWQPHVTYFKGTFEAISGTCVEYSGDLSAISDHCFQVRIDGNPGLLDIRDGDEIPADYAGYPYIIRFTYTQPMGPHYRLIPFPSISFHDWEQYDRLTDEIHYSCNGESILANFDPRIDEPNREVTLRRLYVQALLRHNYGDRADFERTDAEAYWRKVNDCLVMVHVPGFSNNRLDRAQHQMFGLGCCSISPVLQTYFLTRPPTPWEHYVPCLDGYEDLVEKVEWCRENREACVRIGQRAQAFFRSQSIPTAIWAQIGVRIGGGFP